MFKGIETPVEIDDEVWDWLSDPLTMPGLSDEERRLLAAALEDLDLEALQKLFEERLKEQTEAHHGGNSWVGTGGTSPFGHSGFHPGGIRVGGESRNRSAPSRWPASAATAATAPTRRSACGSSSSPCGACAS